MNMDGGDLESMSVRRQGLKSPLRLLSRSIKTALFIPTARKDVEGQELPPDLHSLLASLRLMLPFLSQDFRDYHYAKLDPVRVLCDLGTLRPRFHDF